MNKKIALSAASIITSLALMSGAAFAFFSDTGTSSANVFSTGTLDLKLSDTGAGPETDQDSVTASFGGTLVPGSCNPDQTLELENTGTVAANHAEVRLTNNAVNDAGNNAALDMDRFLVIDKLQYDAGNVISQITDLNGNGWVDLHDWNATPGALDNLALTDLNTPHALVMSVCLHADAGNDLQGDSVTSTFTIDLNQHSSQ
jgi:predicted ribosomally synthesized peptide with SipW-like signal peptide